MFKLVSESLPAVCRATRAARGISTTAVRQWTEIDKASWWCGVDKSQKLQALTREEQANVLRELAKRGISDFGTEDLAMNHSLLQSEAEQTAGSEQKEVYVRHPELL